MNNNKQQPDTSNLGIAIGILLCGLLILAFPRITHMSSEFAIWVCYIVGLLVLCVGIIGTCMEVAKRW